jgi:hypothetical protein
LLKARRYSGGTKVKGAKQTGRFVFTATRSSMNERQIKNDYIESFKMDHLSKNSGVMGIPIHFTAGLPLGFPVKILTQNSMKQPLRYITEKPLIPALFQIAACADDVKSLSDLKNAHALRSTPLAEMLSDPRKLEGILKAIARRKRPAPRRVSASRIYKDQA